jgi:hypothetical protein
VNRASNANKIIKMFFQRRQPRPYSQYVTVSMTAGQRSPSVEKQTLPTKEIMGPKLGTAIATATGMKQDSVTTYSLHQNKEVMLSNRPY